MLGWLRPVVASSGKVGQQCAAARRGFARRSLRPEGVPAVLTVADADIRSPAARRPVARDSSDWSQGPPASPPRAGGYPLPWPRQPRGGAIPRLGSQWVAGHGGNHSPFDDPGTRPTGEPLEPERPPPPWKVLRSHNGNLPVYTKLSKGGIEATTNIIHFFGDVEHMKKEVMKICESPVRLRSGRLEVRGLHAWKLKEWLVSIGM
mmetsp:Transcript_29246/g.83082  ORF Transcript_29246/g.83082 Transcript_29246/m.83082 type:complete len:205 (-) Transcript_29246:98-712(-)